MRFRRLAGWVAVTVCLIAAALLVAFAVKDPERRTLDAKAREGVAGSFVSLQDGVTHYETAGPDSGRVVVLAAGMSVPAYIWDPLFQTLADSGYRVIRYDYYGRGWSDRPAIDYSQDLYVRQLAGLLDSLGVPGPVTLGGVSFGGSVITGFAARHPDRVRSLIYVDPGIVAPFTPPLKLRSSLRWNIDMILGGGSDAMATGQLDDFLHPERQPDWVARYRVQQRLKGTRAAIRAARMGIATGPDVREQLRRVGTVARPVLLIWGREDHTVPIARSDSVRAALPLAVWVPVDSAGHLPFIERPDVVVPAVMAFLRAGG